MSAQGERLLELYPAVVEVEIPPQGLGRRADALEGALRQLDFIALPEWRDGRNLFVYRFRSERDVTLFQDRLAQ